MGGFLILLFVILTIVACFIAIGKPEYAKIGLFALSLVALFIGGCGLLSSGAAVYEWDGWSGYSGIILIISVPSMVFGGLLGWFGWKKFKRTSQPDETASDDLDQ